jgi:hypothetical protein
VCACVKCAEGCSVDDEVAKGVVCDQVEVMERLEARGPAFTAVLDEEQWNLLGSRLSALERQQGNIIQRADGHQQHLGVGHAGACV